MNTWYFHLARGGSRVNHFHFFCLHWITCPSISTVTKAQCYFLLENLIVTCILLSFCMVDNTQMYPSSISPLGLYPGIICNIRSLKRGPWGPELLGERNLEPRPDLKRGTSGPSSYHDNNINVRSPDFDEMWQLSVNILFATLGQQGMNKTPI